MWARPLASDSLRRRFIVPSMPTMGMLETNSAIAGWRQASSSRRFMLSALMRSTRDRPEPLSITSSGKARPRPSSQAPMRRRARSAVAGPLSLPSVRKTWRAITLLLHLLMSRTASASGADSCSASGRAPAGVVPARTVPARLPPSSCHSARIRPPAWASAGNGARLSVFSPHCGLNVPENSSRLPLASGIRRTLTRSFQLLSQPPSPGRNRLSTRSPSLGVSMSTRGRAGSACSVKRSDWKLTSSPLGPTL